MSLLERRKNETKVTDYKVRAIGAYEEALQYLDVAEKMDSKRCELHLISPTITMGVFGLFMTMQMRSGIILSPVLIVWK